MNGLQTVHRGVSPVQGHPAADAPGFHSRAGVDRRSGCDHL